MNKQVKTISLLILILFFSCNNGIFQDFKIIQDLRSKFDIHTVEFSHDINGENLNFILRDLDFYELTENDLKSRAIEINKYLISKYPKAKNTKSIRYDFTSPADVGYVVFNDEGEIIEFTYLKKLMKSI